MIVRILEDGQYELDDGAAGDTLAKLDLELDRAIRDRDEPSFEHTLHALVNEVHTSARPVAPDRIVPSDLTIPAPGSTLAEVRALLAEGGSEEH